MTRYLQAWCSISVQVIQDVGLEREVKIAVHPFDWDYSSYPNIDVGSQSWTNQCNTCIMGVSVSSLTYMLPVLCISCRTSRLTWFFTSHYLLMIFLYWGYYCHGENSCLIGFLSEIAYIIEASLLYWLSECGACRLVTQFITLLLCPIHRSRGTKFPPVCWTWSEDGKILFSTTTKRLNFWSKLTCCWYDSLFYLHMDCWLINVMIHIQHPWWCWFLTAGF